jgi:hypothetical protein
MNLSKERIDEFKGIWKKEYGKELTEAEASQAANDLVGFFDLLMKISWRDDQRKRRLKKEPEGFPVTDGIYTCGVCGRQVPEGESWYDRWGVKCLPCRKAVKDGVVPGFVCAEHDSHYKTWELKDYFGIAFQTAMKQIRQGTLKARVILGENGKPYEYIFLKKENPHLVHRYPPARKSYDRHREREAVRQIRETKLKEKEEKAQNKKGSRLSGTSRR